MNHEYTKEQAKFIEENIKGIRITELTKMFNENFGLNLRTNQIRSYVKNHNLKSGLNTRFKKGYIPWNKGKKGLQIGGKETQFKKGNVPHNYLPIGTERIDSDGYVKVKIADPDKWKQKHLLIWEEYNGSVPDGYCVIFGDGNKRNLDINNLILVSKKQLLMINRHRLIKDDAELTKTGVIIADLYSKISERNKS